MGIMLAAVFDTNIVIDYINGEKPAKKEFASFPNKILSGISYIEVLIGAGNEMQEIKQFLESEFEIVWLNKVIADKAIEARKQYKMKLPDAIILATAFINNAILVTRNTKDFAENEPFIRVPYKVSECPS